MARQRSCGRATASMRRQRRARVRRDPSASVISVPRRAAQSAVDKLALAPAVERRRRAAAAAGRSVGSAACRRRRSPRASSAARSASRRGVELRLVAAQHSGQLVAGRRGRGERGAIDAGGAQLGEVAASVRAKPGHAGDRREVRDAVSARARRRRRGRRRLRRPSARARWRGRAALSAGAARRAASCVRVKRCRPNGRATAPRHAADELVDGVARGADDQHLAVGGRRRRGMPRRRRGETVGAAGFDDFDGATARHALCESAVAAGFAGAAPRARCDASGVRPPAGDLPATTAVETTTGREDAPPGPSCVWHLRGALSSCRRSARSSSSMTALKFWNGWAPLILRPLMMNAGVPVTPTDCALGHVGLDLVEGLLVVEAVVPLRHVDLGALQRLGRLLLHVLRGDLLLIGEEVVVVASRTPSGSCSQAHAPPMAAGSAHLWKPSGKFLYTSFTLPSYSFIT